MPLICCSAAQIARVGCLAQKDPFTRVAPAREYAGDMASDPSQKRGPDAVTHQLPAGELPAGWTLLEGQYEIVRLIASGGFGITYLARDTLGRDVAVKECFPLGLAQRAAMTHTVSATSAGTSEHFETARGQFLREARMLASLRHPNVVHVQSLFEENGTAYMAMDFIHGRDLHEEMVAGAMPPARVLDLARDLLGALDYVHEQGVLHRDIKPQNIRINAFGVPMLIDFGAARAETQARSRMAGTFRVVTDGYSPHEFYVSGAKQGPHSDLYALAATLHHIITGAAPIAADERASAMATGQPDPYVPIADAYPTHDTRLLHLIDRALRMVPGDRPENAQAWLTALMDARTTIVTPVLAAPARRSRLVPGVLIGALLMGAAGAGIWAMQPPWLAPSMGEMQARMSQLEENLATAEAARATAEAGLLTLQETLASAEEDLARLEAADGDMAATMAELDDARAARDAAAAQITTLQTELTALSATAAALEEAQALRNAADVRADTAEARASAAEARAAATDVDAEAEARALAEQIAALDATSLTARVRITTLEASLADATSRLVEARTAAATLAQVETELSATEAELETASARAATLETDLTDATNRLEEARETAALLTQTEAELSTAEADLAGAIAQANTLEGQLQQAEERGAELAAVRLEVQELEGLLEASEAEQARLSDQIATLESAPAPPTNSAELDGLRTLVATLDAENNDLRAALSQAEIALAEAVSAATTPEETHAQWLPHATLRAPNGTFALLPRFSWDNQRIAAVDSTGGIALYDRASGGYEAHLARGIPDTVLRLGFSAGGSYLIATTPNGSPNRLYDVATRREILRFEPVTVTTANRAISADEQYFVFTRDGGGGFVDIVITPLSDLSDPDEIAAERVLSSVPVGTAVRIAFSETTNQINVLTPSGVQIFEPDGRLLRTASNRIGSVAALSPIGADQGFLVLRGNGDVLIYNNLIEQTEIAQVAARTQYSRYRLSGDRLSFLRANDETWDVIDLLTGDVRGTSAEGEDYTGANISISADGEMIFIGATDTSAARLLDVTSGLEIQDFGDATQGYFSFDNNYLATGRADWDDAQIWRMEGVVEGPDLSNCVVIDRTMDGIPILPNTLERGRMFSVEAGGDLALLPCASVQDPGLTAALARVRLDLSVSQAPDVSINILGTSRNYTLAVGASGDCDPIVVARFGQQWLFGNEDQPVSPVLLLDAGDVTQALDVWLATRDGVTCPATITLAGGEDQ